MSGTRITALPPLGTPVGDEQVPAVATPSGTPATRRTTIDAIAARATSNGAASSARTITGTGGLAGGGDLTSNRTISVANLGITSSMIAADAVTYDKLQNVTSGRILGRSSAGPGNAEEIALGTNLSFSGTTLNVPLVENAVFAAPIGSGGGVVPAELRQRFRNVANARTDFGIQLFEPDGITLRDNTTRLQAAIDNVQAYGGAIFFPNEGAQTILTGPVTMRETGVWNRMPISLIGEGSWDTTRGLRNSFVGPPTQFALGPGLKLIGNSAGSLITSPPNAGMLTIERMTLDGNSTFQPTPRRVIDWVDAPAVSYGFSGNLTEVSVTNSVAEGIWVGVNRSMGRFVDTWVQYCGALGGAAAWNIRTYDIQIERPGIGNNPGIGIFLGNSAQFEMNGGAMWNNDKHLVVAAGTLSFIATGVHFDAATAAQVEVARYTADSRPPMRKLVGCYFSRRDTGASGTVPYVDGSADDIVSSCNSLTLIGCSWVGKASGSGDRRSRYNLNMTDALAKTMVQEDAKGFISNTLGFTNAPSQVWRWGDMSASTPGYRIDGDVTFRTTSTFGAVFLRAQDDTFVASLGAGSVGGKEGSLRLWNASGGLALRLGAGTGIGRSFIGDEVAPPFVSDAAAGTAGLVSGELYFNTTTNTYARRGFPPASGGATDLGYVVATRLLTSSTGAGVTLPLFTGTTAGLVPASGGGTSNFLRADGTFAPPPGGGISDGNYGDITVSSGSTVWTINNGVVTLSKMANVATNTLLGRASAGTGVVETIPLTAAGRAILDDADAAAQRTTLELGNSATRNVGTATNTVAAGDDTRIVNAAQRNTNNVFTGASQAIAPTGALAELSLSADAGFAAFLDFERGGITRFRHAFNVSDNYEFRIFDATGAQTGIAYTVDNAAIRMTIPNSPRSVLAGSRDAVGRDDVASLIAAGAGLAPTFDAATGVETLALTGQALALHNLATNGIITRTGAGTVAARSIASGANISVTNGDGVSGNPTVAVTGLAAVATSGSAADLAAGTLPAARLPAFGSGDVSFAAGGGAGTVANDAVTNAKLANMAGNTVKVRAAGTSGDPSDLALAASELLGRGSTGDVAAIQLGAGLAMTGTTLSATGGGSGQAAVQFQDEGTNLGTSGTVDVVNFTGTAVTASRTGNALTVNVTGGGGSPGGSAGQVQWNNAGAFAGASGLTINGTGEPVLARFLDVSEMAPPAAPAADTVRLYAENMAGQAALMMARVNGEPCRVQYNIGDRRFGWMLPSSGTGLNVTGANTASGTVSTPAITTTSLINSSRRSVFTPTAAVNAVAAFRIGEAMLWRGDGVGRGGFEFWLRFATVATNNECAAFFGLTSTLSTNLSADDPGANRENAFGISRVGGATPQTEWHFVRRTGTGTAVAVPLGVTFNTTGGDVWDMYLYSAPGGSEIGVRCLYRPNNWATPSVALDTIYNTTLPTNTATLGIQGALRAGTTSFAPIVAMMHTIWSSDT